MLENADEQWMKQAIAEAKIAGAAGDVPVGAIVVRYSDDNPAGVVIGRGHNQREQNADPTAHAEIAALREASKVSNHWRVEDTLFVTQEPCPMCAGALVNARVKRVVFGCLNPKAGAVESLYNICSDSRLNHRMEVQGGVLKDECAELLKAFFAELRKGPSYR